MTTVIRARFTGAGLNGADPLLLQTYWLPNTAGGSVADATEALARVRAFLNTNILQLATGLVYTATDAVDSFDVATGTLTGTFTGAHPTNVVGTGTGDPMGPAVAWLIRWFTTGIVNGRRLQGRTYLGYPGEGRNDSPGGIPSAAGAAAINASIPALLTTLVTNTQLAIWHKPTKAHPGTGSLAVVTGGTTRTDGWGIQRRRRAGF